jgi:CheY-like chemotaxis protein
MSDLLKNMTILVVDDDGDTCDLLRMMLEDLVRT